MNLVQQIEQNRIIAIMRKVPFEIAEQTSAALIEGGIRLL